MLYCQIIGDFFKYDAKKFYSLVRFENFFYGLMFKKNHKNKPIGPKEIRALQGVKARESAHRAVLMVSGKVSYQAKAEAKELSIEILEGRDFINS